MPLLLSEKAIADLFYRISQRCSAIALPKLPICSSRVSHNITLLLIFRPQFDPDCFQYILEFWQSAQSQFYGTPTQPGLFHAQSSIPLNPNESITDTSQNPLLSKQAIIVLREELEYFSITTPGALARTDITTGLANDELRELKRQCGRALEERTSIFTALQRNVNKENNMAEQHLIDMLCMRWVCKMEGRHGLTEADSTGTTRGGSGRASPLGISSRRWRSCCSRRASCTPAWRAHSRARRRRSST